MRPLTKCGNQSGQSIVEVLIASSILTISALGLTSSLVNLGQSKKKSEQVSYVLALESSIASALSDSSSYSEAQRASFRAGTVPADLRMNLQLPNSPTGTLSVQRGQLIYLDTQLQACAGFDEECIYSFEFEVRNKNELEPLLPVTFGVAYRIEMRSEDSLPLAVGADRPFDAVEDFELEIPPAVYRIRDQNGCADDELFVIGLNRASGAVQCIKRPTNSCAANEVVTGYRVGTTADLRLQLQLECQAVTANVTCPAKYSLQSISMSGYTLNGQCIYAGTEDGDFGSNIISGNVGQANMLACPEDYSVDSSSTCSIQQLSNVTADCMYNRHPPVQGAIENGGPWDDPDIPGTQLCPRRAFVTHNPVPTLHMVENLSTGVTLLPVTRSGRNISCQISVPQAVCGATYSGRITYQPQCDLDAGFRPTQNATSGL